jgi:hypothetical protein
MFKNLELILLNFHHSYIIVKYDTHILHWSGDCYVVFISSLHHVEAFVETSSSHMWDIGCGVKSKRLHFQETTSMILVLKLPCCYPLFKTIPGRAWGQHRQAAEGEGKYAVRGPTLASCPGPSSPTHASVLLINARSVGGLAHLPHHPPSSAFEISVLQ